MYMNFKFEQEKEYIVVGDYSYESLFLSLKKDNPFLKIKYYTKEEVGKELEFEVDDSLISYLMENKDLDYIKAKKLANLLIFANENKFPIKKELLESGIITKNLYGELTFKDKEIYLFECEEDFELIKLLERHNISFKVLKIEDVMEEKSYQNKIYLFKDYTEEFHYFYSDINKLLLEDGIDPKNIYIYMDNPLPFLIEEFSSLYKINSNFKYSRSLLSDPECFKLIDSFFKTKNINVNFDPKELSNGSDLSFDILNRVKNIIATFKLDSKEFDKGYLSLMEILSSLQISSISLKEGINIINKPIFKENIHLYVSNFESNVFYKIYKDDNIYLDRELLKYDLNTSSIKTLLSKRLMGNFLRYSGAKIFAKVKLHLQDKLYDSEFINIYKLKYNEVSINEDGLYTIDASKLVLSTFKDKYLFKKDMEYKSYNSDFKEFNFNDTKNLSVTDFEKYSNCPFKFYVSKYLNVDEFESTYYTNLGNFLHEIMQDVFNDNFDLEKEFEEKLKENKFGFTEIEKVLIEYCVKPYFKLGVENYYLLNKEKFKELGAQRIIQEVKEEVEVPLDEISKIKLIAKADAKFVNGSRCTIFDYKTGSKTFSERGVELGIDLQLPLYSYLLTLDKSKDEDPKGFFIAHILNDYEINNNRYDEEETLKKWKIDGRFAHEDSNYSLLLEGINKEKTKEEMKNGYDYKIDDIIKESVEKMKEIVIKIKNRNFSIQPISLPDTNGKNSCDYCAYRPICYRKNVIFTEGDE